MAEAASGSSRIQMTFLTYNEASSPMNI